jgi:hypothetical protein
MLLALLALGLGGVRAEPAAPAQLSPRVYLPALSLSAGPPATVRFGASLVGGELGGVAESFSAGRAALYYEVSVAGGAGLPFSLEWSLDGVRRPELDRSGALPADGRPYQSGIALSTAAPLPAGAYRLRVFVGGLPAGVGTARIE